VQGKVDEYDKKGQINLLLQFQEKSLKIQIINARNLRTGNTHGICGLKLCFVQDLSITLKISGDCNPYIRIELIPRQDLTAGKKLKTRIQKRSLKNCATFNEIFEMLIYLHLQKA
jgi:C2 domain